MIILHSTEMEMHVPFYLRWQLQSEEKVTWMAKVWTIIGGGCWISVKGG